VKFIPALHGLRGLAAMMVLLSHLGIAGMAVLPLPHDRIGKAGVWVFFVLSAYLLAPKVKAPRDIPAFLLQRFFRIYPLLFVALLLHAAFGHISAADIPASLLLLQGHGEIWAIPVEFKFYLLAPVAGLLLRYAGRATAALWLLAALGMALSSPSPVFSGGIQFVSRITPFVVGTAIALWPRDVSLPTAIGALASTLLAVAAYRWLSIGLIYVPPQLLSLWLATSVGGLVLGIRSTRISSVFGWRPFVWLGEVSFSIYLLHSFVIQLAPAAGMNGFAVVAVTLALAAVSHRFIEQPGIRIGKRIIRRIGMVPQTAVYSK
jgi:peptidoglycan/LPS O-acetylase OafA/YrhL